MEGFAGAGGRPAADADAAFGGAWLACGAQKGRSHRCTSPSHAHCACPFSRPQAQLSGRDRSGNPRQVLRVELTRKQTMMYYQPQKSRLFIKIVLALPTLVAPCRCECGVWSVDGINAHRSGACYLAALACKQVASLY